MSELENMTLLELRNFAKERNIKNISKLKKEELIELLRQIEKSSEPVKIVEKDENLNESKEIRYDEDDEEQLEVNDAVIDYKLTNEDDEIVEGIL